MQLNLRHALSLTLGGFLIAGTAFAAIPGQQTGQDPAPTQQPTPPATQPTPPATQTTTTPAKQDPPKQDPAVTPAKKKDSTQDPYPSAPVAQQDTVKPKNSKEDVDAIGNRKIGGFNMHSLETDIAIGKQYAQEVERSSKLIDDPVV